MQIFGSNARPIVWTEAHSAPMRRQNRREKALKRTMRTCGWQIPARLRQKVREENSGSISLQFLMN
jgi:hypothetical protein